MDNIICADYDICADSVDCAAYRYGAVGVNCANRVDSATIVHNCDGSGRSREKSRSMKIFLPDWTTRMI